MNALPKNDICFEVEREWPVSVTVERDDDRLLYTAKGPGFGVCMRQPISANHKEVSYLVALFKHMIAKYSEPRIRIK